MLPFGQKSNRNASSSELNPKSDRYVFVALLSQDGRHVLVTHNDDDDANTSTKWRLPLFVYSSGLNENSDRLINDIRNKLGLNECKRDVLLSVGPDYFGLAPTNAPQISGFTTLIVVYCHNDLPGELLPSNFQWADAQLVRLLRDHIGDKTECNNDMELVHRAFQVVDELVCEDGETKLNSIRDKRYHREWYISATQWFREWVKNLDEAELGTGINSLEPVLQLSSSATSTILKLPSHHGSYYLKAPCIDSTELATTIAVSNLIPHSVIRVEAVNEQLGCFLMKELARPEAPKHRAALPKMMETLAEVQLISLEKVDELLKRGVPDKRPKKFIKKLKEWLEDEELQHTMFQTNHEQLTNVSARLIEMCERLEESPIPNMLVHGDFAPRNVGLRTRTKQSDDDDGEESDEEEMVIFDWQFGCISHPFSDMHDLFIWDDSFSDLFNESSESELDSLDEKLAFELDTLFEAKRRYLAKFSAHYDIDDEAMEELFELGRLYGICLRFWDTIVCLPSCKFQYKPRLAEHMRAFVNMLTSNADHFSILVKNWDF